MRNYLHTLRVPESTVLYIIERDWGKVTSNLSIVTSVSIVTISSYATRKLLRMTSEKPSRVYHSLATDFLAFNHTFSVETGETIAYVWEGGAFLFVFKAGDARAKNHVWCVATIEMKLTTI